MKWRARTLLPVLLSIVLSHLAAGADWPQFRGPGGQGVSADAKVPWQWSDTQNLKWKTALPGPGSSSPIVSGDRIFVTCYSGYGVDPREPGRLEDLKRHLLCLQRANGNVLWSRSVDAALPEDRFGGMGITEHGYRCCSSHHPAGLSQSPHHSGPRCPIA